MSKKVLLLGAGLVSRPIVNYLLDKGFYVTVASRTLSKAERLVGNHPNGKAIAFDITKDKNLDELVRESDLTVSLLPYTYHPVVAMSCIKNRKPMVTTSYVSDKMKQLDELAKKAGVILLNEIGVDPGIDHMSAMKIIDEVKSKGGKIISFKSYCGGLPAPEANTNPWGYKFSWSPKGVLLAAKNSARYMVDGKIVEVPGNEKLFEDYHVLHFDEIGDYEAYPNRNALVYIDLYKLDDIKTMYRGTLRNLGWCETWQIIHKMNFLDDTPINTTDMTYSDFIKKLLGNTSTLPAKEVFARHFNLPLDSHIVYKFEWLSLFSDEKIPYKEISPIDLLANKLKEKCVYKEGERDMIILHHQFIAQYKDGKKEKILSTMIDFGIPNGDTSMARTVSLPAAIASRFILEGKIKLTGVHIPVYPEIYKPVLEELENLNIKMKESVEPL